jgi:outer membrane lipoprotein-sorting protein
VSKCFGLIKKKMMKRIIVLLLAACGLQLAAFSQDATALVKQVKIKLDKVNDYTAEGRMKTDITFIKAPVGRVKVFFKKPNKFKLKRDGGISILPRGGVSVNMSSLLTSDSFDALSAGESTIGETKVAVVKLLPRDENSDVVLTTLYIDAANLLIRKANTTTRENGTYEMEMNYGKYASYGLPDKVVFAFNTKDYKIPKGVTLDFETSEQPKDRKLKNKKGKVEITYSNYTINQGIADSEFAK